MKLFITYALLIFSICLTNPEIVLSQETGKNVPDLPQHGTSSSNEDEFPLLEDFPLEDDFSLDEELADAENFDGGVPLTTKVNLTFSGTGRILNNDSRLNPNNAIQDIENAEGVFEANLSVSDYVNAQETFRWYFQAYGYYSSETNGQDERVNITRIDEVFADWKSSDLFFSIGKRRINWGHAMAFNPVNVIVLPRDPMNPNQETEGYPVAWLGYSRDVGSVNLFYTRDFDKDWNSDLNRWGAQIELFVGAFDLSCYYFDGEPYKNDREFERMYGMSFSTNLTAGISLYSEVAGFDHNYRNYYDHDGTGTLKDEFFLQGVIGSYIILDPESFLSFLNGDANLLLEVYYNGGGYSPDERKQYFEALDEALKQGNPSVLGDYRFTGMNRFYSLLTYRNSFKERYTTELSGLIAQDLSFSTQFQLTYNLSDYYSINAKYTHNQGETETEFGNAPVSNLFEMMLEIQF